MSVKRREFLGAGAGLLLAGCDRPTAEPPSAMDDAVRIAAPGADPVDIRATTLVEIDALRAVLDDLTTGSELALSPNTRVHLARAHLISERWELPHGPALVVREPIHVRRGAGFYAFRHPASAGRHLALQAPHAYFDRGSGELAARMFFGPRGSRYQALFLNTVHRYRPFAREPESRSVSASDLAHVNEHLFNQATLMLARRFMPLDVVQLHGFANRPVTRRDSSRAPGKPRAVISSGHPESTSFSQAVTARLKDHFGVGVWPFPEKAGELGGVGNAQARTLAAVPDTRFVHIEMAARMRRDLGEDMESLEAFERCLHEAREST